MINILDKNTIDKIAAGEVIQRPSSIVKELVENSMDAGANMITVEIRNGGASIIRVTDNGCGIEKNDVKKAFLRHATSKLKDVSDLLVLSSYGFRGEALSSISSISKTEIITKVKDDITGIRYILNGGEEEAFEEIGAPDGTTIIIKDIFFNTPARKKFLKSDNTEANYIYEIMLKLALSHPDKSFRFINNSSVKIHTSGNDSLKEVIYRIYGREIANNLIEINYSDNGIKVSGYVGKPSIIKSNRSNEVYFVNGRYIKNKDIANAIEEAYGDRLMQNKFPFCVINIDMSPDMVDVNVHPAKAEVRFADLLTVYNTIFEALNNTFLSIEMVKNETPLSLREKKTQEDEELKNLSNIYKKSAEPFEVKKTDYLSSKNNILYDDENNISNSIVSDDMYTQYLNIACEFNNEDKKNEVYTEKVINKDVDLKNKQLSFLDNTSIKSHKIIGQIFSTYWIVEFNNKIFIIDQHAAHEKIIYERYMNEFKNSRIASQFISPALIIKPLPVEKHAIEENIDVLKSMGYELEEYGNDEYRVVSVPYILPSISKEILLEELISSLVNVSKNMICEIIVDKTASMACKAAIKGNTVMSVEEYKALINELMKLENPYNCPHGRPVIIEMTKNELEKKFKRIV